MRRAISILSILGIVIAATLFIFLATSTINAPVPPPSDMVQEKFKGFPLNEARFIEFEVDEDAFERLTHRERRDQILDWLLYTAVSDAGLSVEIINQSLFDIPAIRYGYMHPIANFEYGETRSVYIGNGKVVALVPADSSADQRHDHLAHIADKHRKNLGEIPPTLLVFDYQLDPDAQFAMLTRRQEFDTQGLYTKDSGYYEVEVRSLGDLESLMEQIDDITFARVVDGNLLKLAGRKIRSREYRGIRVEDVAAIWQAEKKIHEQREEFEAFWSQKREEFIARWNKKIKDFANSYGSSEANILVEAINEINSLETVLLLTIPIDELIGKVLPPNSQSDEKLTSTLKQYIKERIALLQQMIDAQINRRLVQGSGFSLDPTHDYDGLMSFFEEIEPQLQQLASEDASPITMQDIEKAKNALAKHAEIRFPEVPFLTLADRLSKNEALHIAFLGELISQRIREHRFQAARYDGDLQGTEVGMVLFYTDLLAKLWAIDYMHSAPDQYIEDFKPMTEVSISPIYEKEMEDLPSTRLWFGPQDKGFQLADEGSSLLFARNAVRVYAASSNPLEPGKEVAPNAASAAFLGWWNDHYEEVAQHEQEYERLNEIMKWSLLISWLNKAGKGDLLGFLKSVNVKHSNWFPQWVRGHPKLTFQQWDQIDFYDQGYKGTKTEAMPILYSQPFKRFGKERTLFGGVSLAPKSLFEGRKPLAEAINRLLRRSNIDYGSPGLGNQSLRTYEGIEYTFQNLASNLVSMMSRVKEGTKLRGRYAELVHGKFERIISQKPLSLSVKTRVGGNYVGNLEISRTEKGFKVGWRSREIDAGQSLARRLSKSNNPDQVLLEDPTVEAMFKLSDEHHYLVKMWGMDRWMKIAPEKEPSAEIASGWQSRVADPEGASQNLLLTWMDEGAVRAELARQEGYIVIESVEGTNKIIWKSTPLAPPGVSKKLLLEIMSGDITIQGQLDENGAMYLSWDELSKTLQDEDDWIGLQKLIRDSDLEQIRKMARDTPTVRYTIPKTRFFDNTRFIRKLKTALKDHDYPKVAQDIANAPQEFRMRLDQYLVEELKRSDKFLANGHFVKAVQHLNDLIAIYGPRPELTLRKRIAEIGWRNKISPQLTARILDGSLLGSLPSKVQDALLENGEALRKLDARLCYTKYPQIALLAVNVGKPVYLLTLGEGGATKVKVMEVAGDVAEVLKKIEQEIQVPTVRIEDIINKSLSRDERAIIRDELVRPLVEHLGLKQVGEDQVIVDVKGKEFALLDLPNEPIPRALISYFLRGNRLVGVSAHSTARDVEAKLQATIDLRKLKIVFSLPWSKIEKLPEPERTRIIQQYRDEIERLRERIRALSLKYGLNIKPEEVIVDLTDLPAGEAQRKMEELSRKEDSMILSFWEALPLEEGLEIGRGGRFTKADVLETPAPTPGLLIAYTSCRGFVTGWPDVVIKKRGVLSLAFWDEISIGDAFRFVNRLVDELEKDPDVPLQAFPLLLNILEELNLRGMLVVEVPSERAVG